MVNQQQLEQICHIAVEAGASIMQIYQNNSIDVRTKSDETPVTAADIAAHKVIVNGLQSLPYEYPILSEEDSLTPWEVRKKWYRYWLIDPLDGTKEFINRNGEFTVNIALIDNGRPVAGVVYAPALNQCYFGAENLGAWCKEGEITRTLPFKSITLSKLTIVGSRSHKSPEMATYLEQFSDYELASVGSSLKFCLLATGEAHLYPRLGPTSEWDTAAGQAVLTAAGGQVTLLNSNEALKYNQKDNILNPQFLACSHNYDREPESE